MGLIRVLTGTDWTRCCFFFSHIADFKCAGGKISNVVHSGNYNTGFPLKAVGSRIQLDFDKDFDAEHV